MKCSFCNRPAGSQLRLVEHTRRRLAICSDCVDKATAILKRAGIDARSKRNKSETA